MASNDDTETVAISDMTYAMVLETGTLVKEGFLMKRPSRRAPRAVHAKWHERRTARLSLAEACEAHGAPPVTRCCSALYLAGKGALPWA